MIIRKNIALEEKHLHDLEPLLEKHNNNLSAAVRDAIEFSNMALNNFETLDEAAEHLKTTKVEFSKLEDSIQSGRNVVISHPTMLWFLKYTRGLLMDREVLEEVLDPLNINTITELDKAMNDICQDFGWQVKVSLFSMDNLHPEAVTLMVSDGTEVMREFVALHIAQFFAYSMELDVEIVHKRATSVRIDFKRVINGEEFEGLNKSFGYNHALLNEIIRKPKFWRTMVAIHMATNYSIVSMYSTNFESIMAGKPIEDTSVIESFLKKHISDIPHPEFIETLKLLHENMGVVEKIEHSGTDIIKIYHRYKDDETIGKLTEFYKFILEANGQHFDAKYSPSLIILERSGQ